MKLSVTKRIVSGFIFSVFAFAWLGIFSIQYNKKVVLNNERLFNANQILYHTQKIESISTDIETAQRGFVVTLDSIFLEPYNNAVSEVDAHINSLRVLLEDEAQQADLNRLSDLIEKKNSFSVKTIVARNVSFDSARALITSYEGKEIMDEIRHIVHTCQERANASIHTLLGTRARESAKLTTTNLGIIFTGVLLLCLLFVAINRNANTRLKAELKQKNILEELQDLYDNAPCGYHSLDRDGYFTRMNKRELEWLGYTHDEVIGKMKFTDILAPSSLVTFQENFELFKKTGSVSGLEFDLIRKDGTLLPVLLNATALRDERGNYLRSRSTVYDNSERKILEQKIRKASDEIFDLYNYAPCGYFSVDKTGKILTINRTLLLWLGYTDNEIAPDTNISCFLTSPINTWSVTDPMHSGGMAYESEREVEFKTKEGELFSAIIISQPVFDEAGDFVSSRCAVIDNSERKRAEEKIKTLNHELEAFTYSVSHDLRGPLRLMNGYAEMLKEDFSTSLNEEGMRIVDVIMKNSIRLGRLIDDLLDFSRLSRKDIMTTKVNFSEMVENVLKEITPGGNGKLSTVIQPLQPAYADSALMHQVWYNLISNAVKYSSHREKITIEIGSEVNDQEIWYYVKDNGAGFDMQYSDKLFEVFQRLHKQSEFEGSGVGLALVKRIITRHGGRIWAKSAPDKGATFYFTLPNR